MPTWTKNSLNINARQRGKWEPSHMGSVDFKWTSGAVTFCRNRFYAQTVRLNQPASHESEPGDGIWVSFGYVDGSFLRSPRPTNQIFDYAWFGMIRYNSGNYVYMYIYIYQLRWWGIPVTNPLWSIPYPNAASTTAQPTGLQEAKVRGRWRLQCWAERIPRAHPGWLGRWIELRVLNMRYITNIVSSGLLLFLNIF